jgi:sulfur-oxidizing protein SoxY
MQMAMNSSDLTRREVFAGAVAIAIVPLAAEQAVASPEELAAFLKQTVGEASLKKGRVKLEIPELAENGNSVPLTIAVDSPMTEADHVKTIHVLSERNPVVEITRIHLGPRAGRAKVSMNIRLATTQRITALAEMSDGSFWSGEADVIVTLAACIDGT